VGKRGEFMCLGRVKGTRVVRQVQRTANGPGGGQLRMQRAEDETQGGTDALARRARYRDEFHSPDRFRRRGRDAEGRFRDRESTASQIREGYYR